MCPHPLAVLLECACMHDVCRNTGVSGRQVPGTRRNQRQGQTEQQSSTEAAGSGGGHGDMQDARDASASHAPSPRL